MSIVMTISLILSLSAIIISILGLIFRAGGNAAEWLDDRLPESMSAGTAIMAGLSLATSAALVLVGNWIL